MLVPIDDIDLRVRLKVTRRYRPWLVDNELQLPLLIIPYHSKDEPLELLNDLVHILAHAQDRLVRVQHSTRPKRPNGPAGQRRQQDSPGSVSQRLTVAPLQGLD